MNSTKMKRALLWGFPILIVGVLIFFFIADRVVQAIDQSYQEARQALGDWTILDRDCRIIRLDNSGKVWVAGDSNLHYCGGRPYMFDGTKRVDIKYQHSIDDFAVDPSGQVWVIPEGSGEPLISVYNGKQWRTYTYQDIGMSSDRWTPLEIEVDSKGRIWVEISNFENDDRELLVFENESWKVLSNEDTGLPADQFFNIKSDAEGRIWLTYPYLYLASDDFRLYVFDGINSRQILYNGERLKNISDIAFDKQNHLWIVDRCGDIGEFTDLMETYPKEITAPELQYESNCNGGGEMYIDDRERIWLWGNEQIRMFENGTWMTLTLENSGLVGDYSIDDLVVDHQDRVWILSDKAIHMIPVKDIRTLPQKLVDRWRRAMHFEEFRVAYLFLALFTLVVGWLMALLNIYVLPVAPLADSFGDVNPRTERLAKRGLIMGNIAFGIFLFPILGVLFLRFTFPPSSVAAGDLGMLLVFGGFPLIGVIGFILILGIWSITTDVLTSIKKESGNDEIGLKKMAQRGAIIGGLGVAVYVLTLATFGR